MKENITCAHALWPMKLNYIITYFLLLFSLSSFAHNGPAYPILIDKEIDAHKISIWADPDFNEGIFSIFIEGDQNSNFKIEIESSPFTDPVHILSANANFISNDSKRSTYKSTIFFDRPDQWNVKFTLKKNNLFFSSFTLPVNVSPQGPNKLEFAVYALPFLLTGVLLYKVIATKRKGLKS